MTFIAGFLLGTVFGAVCALCRDGLKIGADLKPSVPYMGMSIPVPASTRPPPQSRQNGKSRVTFREGTHKKGGKNRDPDPDYVPPRPFSTLLPKTTLRIPMPPGAKAPPP